MLEQFPPEVLNAIFEHVQPKQLLDLCRCCRWLNDVIRSSSLTQYRIQCWAAGVVDDSPSSLSYAERLVLLREREDRWRWGNCLKEVNIDVPSATGFYDLGGSLLVVSSGPTSLSALTLPSSRETSDSESEQWQHYTFEDPFVDFGLAVEDVDLIAVVTSKLHHETSLEMSLDTAYTVETETFSRSFNLHILSASTGQHHPLSSTPLINFCYKRWGMGTASATIKVFGDWILILLLNPVAADENERENSLYVVNWKNGTNALCVTAKPRTYWSIVALSPDLIALPNTNTFCLDLYQFHVVALGAPLLLPYGRLQLPRLQPSSHLLWYQCISPSNVGPGYLPHTTASNRARALHSSPEDAIVVFAFQFEAADFAEYATMVVHRKTLVDASSAANEHGPLPYDQWGSDRCSWIIGIGSFITQSSGQRLVVHRTIPGAEDDEPTRSLSIRDYNPYHTRQLGKVDDDKYHRDSVRVARDGYLELPAVFEEPVESGLPYVETKFAVDHDENIGGFMLDDERLIGIRMNHSHNISALNVKVFG